MIDSFNPFQALDYYYLLFLLLNTQTSRQIAQDQYQGSEQCIIVGTYIQNLDKNCLGYKIKKKPGLKKGTSSRISFSYL